MAESEKAKARRLEKLREKRRLERERTGDTPEAEAERAKKEKEYDPKGLGHLGARTGIFG